ncbi:MAG TPA: indole-3-glycerol phosphate synthase TrpC [Stellaceae bacterium]|nr:indole-3-glycerol phosphate synthase TrpC [Stellaceae bacterium]
MSDVLRRILADKREHVTAARQVRSLASLDEAARQTPAPRGFIAALRGRVATDRPALIAEIKRASPSRGLIRADFDPATLAVAYKVGGACCLSVLTDQPYFQGSPADLAAARAAVDLPILRKDFMIDPWQIAEARAIGADCILLIMAALDDTQAAELEAAALDYGLDVLVEVHDAAELDRALALRTTLIGINNRDLKTLEIDLATTERLAPGLPADRLVVCESGLGGPGDLARMAAIGVHCFLIGESLMRQPDVTAATRALLSGAA